MVIMSSFPSHNHSKFEADFWHFFFPQKKNLFESLCQDGTAIKHDLQRRWCLWVHQRPGASKDGQLMTRFLVFLNRCVSRRSVDSQKLGKDKAWNESQREVHSFDTVEELQIAVCLVIWLRLEIGYKKDVAEKCQKSSFQNDLLKETHALEGL